MRLLFEDCCLGRLLSRLRELNFSRRDGFCRRYNLLAVFCEIVWAINLLINITQIGFERMGHHCFK